ncbi:hypothetical protein WDJ51_05945 [Rathayibacter sp. YIM 133350]|uniref:hypothetical protein n=1 Tax=Rathayibacter sp. YIM 133350 TaxID=3131992 RepID=UPI00307D595E
MAVTREAAVKTLRPRRHIFANVTVAASVLLLPVFAALYWLTAPVGLWPIVLLIQIVVSGVCIAALFSTRHVYFRLHEWGVEDHVPFGFTRQVRSADVDTILMLDLYSGTDLETHPHLFAVDAHDRLLLRMHGQLWSRASIQQVASRLGAPVVHAPAPMTLAEFTSIEPQLLPWWERRPMWRTPRRTPASVRAIAD